MHRKLDCIQVLNNLNEHLHGPSMISAAGRPTTAHTSGMFTSQYNTTICIFSAASPGTATTIRGRKIFEVLSDSQKRERRSQIKDKTNVFLDTLVGQIGLKPHSMKLETTSGHLVDFDFQSRKRPHNSDQDKPQEITNNLLYILMKYGISFECYHELTQQYPCLPRTYKVIKFVSTCGINHVFHTYVGEGGH